MSGASNAAGERSTVYVLLAFTGNTRLLTEVTKPSD